MILNLDFRVLVVEFCYIGFWVWRRNGYVEEFFRVYDLVSFVFGVEVWFNVFVL